MHLRSLHFHSKIVKFIIPEHQQGSGIPSLLLQQCMEQMIAIIHLISLKPSELGGVPSSVAEHRLVYKTLLSRLRGGLPPHLGEATSSQGGGHRWARRTTNALTPHTYTISIEPVSQQPLKGLPQCCLEKSYHSSEGGGLIIQTAFHPKPAALATRKSCRCSLPPLHRQKHFKLPTPNRLPSDSYTDTRRLPLEKAKTCAPQTDLSRPFALSQTTAAFDREGRTPDVAIADSSHSSVQRRKHRLRRRRRGEPRKRVGRGCACAVERKGQRLSCAEVGGRRSGGEICNG